MEKTGERYAAARQVLIQQAANGSGRTWISPPETSDEAVVAATGRSYDEWCDLIEAWPGHEEGHAAIAAYLADQHGLDGWWSQTVTVGYERISGIRLPHQQSDGTFTANKSATVTVDADMLRAALLDAADRADLFPGVLTELRSKADAKTLRMGVEPGVAQIAIDAKRDGKAKVTIQHEKLPTAEAVEEWKHFWSEWLQAIDEG